MNILDFFFEFIPVVFILLLVLFFSFKTKFTKMKKPAVKEEERPRYLRPVKTQDSSSLTSSGYSFCPYCNTKIIKTNARLCPICRSHHICPSCRKCINKDQHRGM